MHERISRSTSSSSIVLQGELLAVNQFSPVRVSRERKRLLKWRNPSNLIWLISLYSWAFKESYATLFKGLSVKRLPLETSFLYSSHLHHHIFSPLLYHRQKKKQFSREIGYSYRWLWEIKILPLPPSGANRGIMGWQGVTGAHLQYGWAYTDAAPISLSRSICHHLLNKLRANTSRL